MIEKVETGIPLMTDSFFLDYSSGRKEAVGFFEHDWSRADWASAVDPALNRNGTSRAEVSEILIEQCRDFELGSQAVYNAGKLRKGAVAVVTGQQPGILGGPVYTMYKALTAIKLAAHISETTGVDAVPVFWMEAEDHDRKEIGTSRLLSMSGEIFEVEVPSEVWPDRVPSSLVAASSFIESRMNRLREALAGCRFADDILEMVAESYSGQNVPGGFARLMGRLLPKEAGMLLLDPSRQDVKALSRGFFLDAVSLSSEIHQVVVARTSRIRESGYKPQIKPRGDDTWLFLLEEGRRSRLSRDADRFRSNLTGNDFSSSELKELAADEPERLSTGVALRPVLQDTLLPTVAYVGGPSEIAYLAQLRGVYELVGLSMPTVYPRASYTMLDRRTFEMSKSLFDPDDPVLDSRETAVANLVGNWDEDSPERSVMKLNSGISRTLGDLEKTMAKIDPTLVESARSSAEKMEYHLSKLLRKASRARIAKKDGVAMDALNILDEILPLGAPQERIASIISLYGKYGKDLVELVAEDIEINGRFGHKVISMTSEIRKGVSDES